jgi:preprotein translocase subunit YajC
MDFKDSASDLINSAVDSALDSAMNSSSSSVDLESGDVNTETGTPSNNSSSEAKNGCLGGDGSSLIFMGIAAVALIGLSIYNNHKQKKRQEEAQKELDAIKPGTKIKTIGGICGVVTEVKADTLVLETGGEKKSYITFDKRAIAESDAVAEEKKEEKSKKDKKEKAEEAEEAVAEMAEEVKEEKTEEANDKE